MLHSNEEKIKEDIEDNRPKELTEEAWKYTHKIKKNPDRVPMTSSEDEGLKKKAPSTQIKTWIIIIPVKNSDSVEYPHDTRSR